MTAPAASADLADRVLQLAESHPPRTPKRRAAAALYVALTTTKTSGAVRRALATFASPAVRAAAAAILDQMETAATGRATS